MTFEALIAARALLSIMGISIELIDMRSVRPLDSKTVIDSVKKTGRLIVADTAYKTGSIAAELISQVVEGAFKSLKSAPIRVCLPDFPTPTAPSMTEEYYPTPRAIVDAVLTILGQDSTVNSYQELISAIALKGMHDIPNREFKGPF
jgi:pyruvate dehydrogenase E1 component beta subunit